MCLVWCGMNLIKVSRKSVMIDMCTLWQKSEKKKEKSIIIHVVPFTNNSFSFLFLFGSAELN